MHNESILIDVTSASAATTPVCLIHESLTVFRLKQNLYTPISSVLVNILEAIYCPAYTVHIIKLVCHYVCVLVYLEVS